MANVLFLLMGLVVLDIIMSQNRRHRPHYPPYYRDDAPYSPPYHAPRYSHESDNFAHNYPHYRHNSGGYPTPHREQSPVVATLIFILFIIGLLYFLGH